MRLQRAREITCTVGTHARVHRLLLSDDALSTRGLEGKQGNVERAYDEVFNHSCGNSQLQLRHNSLSVLSGSVHHPPLGPFKSHSGFSQHPPFFIRSRNQKHVLPAFFPMRCGYAGSEKEAVDEHAW